MGGCAPAVAQHDRMTPSPVGRVMARSAAFIAVTMLAMVTLAAGAHAQTPGLPTDWRSSMLARINEVRAEAGVPPVALCKRLQRAAGGYARQMAREDYFAHVGPDGVPLSQQIEATGYRARAWAENIAAGQRSVAEVMDAWQASPAHYASIVNPLYRHVGLGYATGESSRYGVYWVQEFGRGGSCRSL